MVRHVVLLTLRPEAPPDQAAVIVEHLRGLPEQIGAIRRYAAGVDLGVNDGNADVCVVADFDDVDGYLVYRDHPAHQAAIRDHIAPHLASRTASQVELDA